MNFIDLKENKVFNFQKFLEGVLDIIELNTVEPVVKIETINAVSQNWTATFDRTFFSGNNSLSIYFSSIKELLKFRLKFVPDAVDNQARTHQQELLCQYPAKLNRYQKHHLYLRKHQRRSPI